MLIDHLGNQRGVMDLNAALSIAQENNLDLVQISEGKDVPICKILDFGKYSHYIPQAWRYNVFSNNPNKPKDKKMLRVDLTVSEKERVVDAFSILLIV